jgi:hypothetical protein
MEGQSGRKRRDERSEEKGRGSDYHLLIAASSVVLVIAIISGFVLLAPPAPAATETRFAFREGDYLNYSISGTYEDKAVTGTYNATTLTVENGYASGFSTSYGLSDQEVGSNLSALGLPSFSVSGQYVGTGRFATPFGLKEVKWNFQAHPDGLFEIDYYGIDPFVVYGGVINGKGTHLDFVLNGTANPSLKEGSTRPIATATAVFPTTTSDSLRYEGVQNVTACVPFFHPHGGTLAFNASTTAAHMDIYAFSDGNIRSMAEGGPFAYDLKATKLGAGNISEAVTMPPGLYILALLSHDPAPDLATETSYQWNVTWNE